MAAVHRLLIFLKRKQGLSHAEFRAHYEGVHVPLCAPYMAGPVLYRRRFLKPNDNGSGPEFDVVTELGFPSVEMRDTVLAAMAADHLPPEVVADEMNFIDRPASRFCAADMVETEL